MSGVQIDEGSAASRFLPTAAFCLCIALLAFIAGTFFMYRDIFPASYLAQSYQGGLALWDKMTRYQDPYLTDFWFPERRPDRGVTVYDPARAANGLTLYSSGHDHKAFLIDMEGRVVHEWAMPYSRIWDETAAVKRPQPDSHIYIEKAYVFPNGDLLALYVAAGDSPWGYGLVKLNRNSEVIWKYLAHAHHDFAVEADGSVWGLTHEITNRVVEGYEYLKPPRIDDFIVHLSPEGEEVSKIWLLGAMAASPFGRWLNIVPWYVGLGKGDYLHTNNIDLLAGNLEKLPGVEEGDLLLSFREISTIAVLDPESERVVWAMPGPWLRQHDPDLLPNGNILLFDNEGVYGDDGTSRVIEIDPATHQIVWTYGGTSEQPLDSVVRSSEERLANGNTLIVESNGGRVVEVTPEGEPVWEFVNPVRGGENEERIPIIFWVKRIDPATFDPDFRDSLS